MPTIEESVEVNVPVRAAYDQWTQYEEFPRFMEGVREVRRVDDTHLHWVGDGTHEPEEWDSEITEQAAGRRIAWRSTSGARNDGAVDLEPVADDVTRVRVAMEREAAGAPGYAERRVRRDMERFKDLVESRAAAAGEVGRDDDDATLGPEGYSDSTHLPSLSRLRGMTVVNREDEKVGKVKEVYLDAGADHVRYLGVSTGRLSRGIHVVPIDDVTYIDDGADAYVVVPYTVEHLKGAPSLGDDDELSPDREREIYEHYDRVGYWDAARDAVRARQTTPAPTPRIAEAEVVDAIARGGVADEVRVKRWSA
jgi:sporulation protein YlmC with PRC-barrel domain